MRGYQDHHHKHQGVLLIITIIYLLSWLYGGVSPYIAVVVNVIPTTESNIPDTGAVYKDTGDDMTVFHQVNCICQLIPSHPRPPPTPHPPTSYQEMLHYSWTSNSWLENNSPSLINQILRCVTLPWQRQGH